MAKSHSLGQRAAAGGETHAFEPESEPSSDPRQRAVDRDEMAERVRALRLDESDISGRGGLQGVRWGPLIVAAAVCAVVAIAAWRPLGRLACNVFMPAREVDSLTVTPEYSVDVVLDTTGYVAADNLAKVSSRIPGTVVELNADEGDRVTAGQVLARLDHTQYQADLDQAKAGVAAAEARLADARQGAREEDVEQARAAVRQVVANRDMLAKHLQRARQLDDAISLGELERIEASQTAAEAQVTQAEQTLRALEAGPRPEQVAALEADVKKAQALVDKAEYFVGCSELKSPVSGTVLERTAELGESVVPETAMGPVGSLFTIADLSRLNVEIDIQEQDLSRVRTGLPCVVTTEAFPEVEYRGRLAWLSPVFNRQRGICPAKVRIVEPDDKLMPDMNCRVRILAEESPEGCREVIRVPTGAVVHEQGDACVYVLDEDVARRRKVVSNGARDGKAEISEGLASGDVVLLPGDEPLGDGQRVRIRE